MKVMWLGTYERDYPRARVLIEGLREGGVEVVERHRPVWERERHKAGAFLRPLPLARARRPLRRGLGRAGGGGRARAAGSTRSWRAIPPSPTRCRRGASPGPARVPLVVDMMISLADTLAGDRARAGRLRGPRWRGADRVTLAAADLVVADTAAGADWLAARFGVPAARLAVVPVGAEPGRFPAAAAAGRAADGRSSTASSRRCTGSPRCSRRRAGPARPRCA